MVMARVGQTLRQMPQPVQISELICARMVIVFIATSQYCRESEERP
jgi:hypothetical protein